MNRFINHGRAAVLMISAGILSMGATTCNKPANTARVLKLDVEVGSIQAYSITGPSGEVINFPFIANALFYQEVMNSDHFVIMNPIPSPTAAAAAAAANSVHAMAAKVAAGTAAKGDGEISDLDIQTLSKFGFLNSVSTSGANKAASKGSPSVSVMAAVQPSSVPACLYNTPQAILTGAVVSFQLTDSAGIGIGYGASGPLSTTQIGVGFSFSQSKLDIALRSDDPLSEQVIAIGDGVSSQNKFTVGLGLPISGIPLDLNFMYQTPIANAVRSAFDKGITSVENSYLKMLSTKNQWSDVWESRVVYDPVISDLDTHVVIRGGYRAGMQLGDQFSITNMDYKWTGAPCASALAYRVPLSSTPIATATLIAVGDNVAVATLTFLQDQVIQPGAQVKILKLIDPTARPTPSPSPAPTLTPVPSATPAAAAPSSTLAHN